MIPAYEFSPGVSLSMNIDNTAPLSLPILLLNLALGIGVSLVIAWYYAKYGNSLSNRTHFAAILPMLTLITLLVISIVKSSLALSLGLVGALSIVRFRTAIKDPEELIFLFFALAIGLGFGADQRIPTLGAFAFIMLFLAGRAFFFRRHKATHNLYLNIQVATEQAGTNTFTEVNEILLKELSELDLRRLDHVGQRLQMTYYVNVNDETKLIKVMNTLRNTYPESSVSLVEQSNLLGG
jgi:signal transduction histidine kinase